MSAIEPKAGPDRVVFATMPGFELVRYSGFGWRLWSEKSGKDAKLTPDLAWQIAVTKEAVVNYGLDGGTRFYGAVHRSNSDEYDYRHHSSVWGVLPPNVARKLMPDELPAILADYGTATTAASEARQAFVKAKTAAEAAWEEAVATVSELPQFRGMELDVPENGWPCLESPLLVCMYDDNAEDEYRLRCLICGEPHERG